MEKVVEASLGVNKIGNCTMDVLLIDGFIKTHPSLASKLFDDILAYRSLVYVS